MTTTIVPATPEPTEPDRDAAAMSAPPNSRRGWADRGKISETVRDHQRHLALGIALAVALTAADAVLMSVVANILLGSDPWKSWLLVLGMCSGIVVTAVLAGNQLRYALATGKTIHGVFTGVLLAAWLTLGMLLMIVRWNSGALENTAVIYQDGAMPVDEGSSSPHLWLALLLLGMHVVLGVVAILDGYRLTNPVAAELRRINTQLAELEPELAAAESDYVRATDLLRIARKEEARIDDDLDEARKHADAVFEQLRDAVRLHIAALLGDPGATSGARRRPVPVRN